MSRRWLPIAIVAVAVVISAGDAHAGGVSVCPGGAEEVDRAVDVFAGAMAAADGPNDVKRAQRDLQAWLARGGHARGADAPSIALRLGVSTHPERLEDREAPTARAGSGRDARDELAYFADCTSDAATIERRVRELAGAPIPARLAFVRKVARDRALVAYRLVARLRSGAPAERAAAAFGLGFLHLKAGSDALFDAIELVDMSVVGVDRGRGAWEFFPALEALERLGVGAPQIADRLAVAERPDTRTRLLELLVRVTPAEQQEDQPPAPGATPLERTIAGAAQIPWLDGLARATAELRVIATRERDDARRARLELAEAELRSRRCEGCRAAPRTPQVSPLSVAAVPPAAARWREVMPADTLRVGAQRDGAITVRVGGDLVWLLPDGALEPRADAALAFAARRRADHAADGPPLLQWLVVTGRDPLELAAESGTPLEDGTVAIALGGLAARVDPTNGDVLEVASYPSDLASPCVGRAPATLVCAVGIAVTGHLVVRVHRVETAPLRLVPVETSFEETEPRPSWGEISRRDLRGAPRGARWTTRSLTATLAGDRHGLRYYRMMSTRVVEPATQAHRTD